MGIDNNTDNMKTTSIIGGLVLGTALLTACQESQVNSSENEVIEAIMTRRSIRRYQDKAVPRELLQKVAECGIHAPNAMNAQRWAVRIVDSQEYIDGITKIFADKNPELAARNTYFKNMFRNAPAIICVGCEDWRFGDIDCGLMGENMMLAAHSLGLGTCCLGGPVDFIMNDPDARPYFDALQFPEGYRLRYVLAIGWPEEKPEPRPRDVGKISFVDFPR